MTLFLVLSNLAYSQTITLSSAVSDPAKFKDKVNENRIRWTRQLPTNIRKAFNQTRFRTWYIEKMVSYSEAGKTVYRFSLDNGNLLDGDHHDCFLEKTVVTLSDNETIIPQKRSE